MTHDSNELEGLWNADPATRCTDPAELLRQIENTARRFDRTIRLRDWRESAAGALVVPLFIWFAFRDHAALDRAAHLWLAACGVWVIFYLRRYAQAARKPAAEQSLMTYQQELIERYDRQIRLLRRVKYWYVLPFWIGFELSAVSAVERTHNVLLFAALAIFFTLLSGFVWWLNEGPGVRSLQAQRAKLEAAISR